MSSYVFFNEFYLTSVRDSKDFDYAGIHPHVQRWLKFGRPDIAQIFQQTRELCVAENISRVAVCVCGPPPLVNDVKDMCRQSQMSPGCSTIRFDCHSEVFDF